MEVQLISIGLSKLDIKATYLRHTEKYIFLKINNMPNTEYKFSHSGKLISSIIYNNTKISWFIQNNDLTKLKEFIKSINEK
jgi:hypothetical protein